MFRNGWFWLVLLAIIVVATGFCFVIFCPQVQIERIIISGNHEATRSGIEEAVVASITHDLLGIGSWHVYSKSIFLVNAGHLEKKILNKFAIIDRVNISREFLQTITVDVSERRPVAVFCPSLNVNIFGEQCYFLDSSGVIFKTADSTSGQYLIVRQSFIEPIVFGQQIMAQDTMASFLMIDKTLKDNFQIGVKNAIFASDSKINIITNENWYIYLGYGPNYSSSEQITKLNSLLEKGISAQERKDLRYVDLRPESRAIFCDNNTCGG